MTAPTVLYVRDVPDPLATREAAGRPVRTHLADRRAELFAAPVGAAHDHAGSLFELASGNGVVIVDGRAWFDPGVTTAGWLPPDGSDTCRVVGSDSETLAVFLDRNELTGAAAAGPLQEACEQVLAGTSQLARDARTVVEAGILIDGYDDVARLEAALLQHRAAAAMSQGVWLRDPGSVHIRGSLVCGAHVTIDVGVIFEGDVILGDHVRVDAHCIVRGATIRDNTWVKPFSLVEEADIGSGCIIGPYARIRPESRIGDTCQIGNFVEIKSSIVGSGSRVNHHSFIGDAVLDDRVTIGAGTITCNHDGVKTNQTIIGREAYVGSGCKLVAPLRVGDAATIGAGSTITHDVPAGTLTLARSRQVTVPGWQRPQAPRHEP
jgi:acetyltransferase-like isoleucine patch superfamily enzyme